MVAEKIKQIFIKYKNFILYGIIGGFCSSLDFFITVILNEIGINSLISNIIGVFTGITVSFFLNAYLNFKQTDKLLERALKFYTVGFLGLLLSLLILILGDALWGYHKPITFFGISMGTNNIEAISDNSYDWHFIIVKFISIFVVALFQFFLNKFVTFKKSK